MWQERRRGERALKSDGCKLIVIYILLYSQFFLFAVVMFFKVATNTELANTETLLIGEIQG